MTAERVVSLVPSWTETVCALGAGKRLVACTRYCVEPAADLGGVPRIGGTKNPDLEALAAFDPDLVLVNSEENRADDVAWLRQRFPVYEAMPRTVPEAGTVIRDLGQHLDADEESRAMLLELDAQITRGEVERLTRGTVRVFYVIWPKPWMSVNRDTYIHDVLTRAGALNVAAEHDDRYPSFDASALRQLGAELVLLPDEPYEFGVEHRDAAVRDQLFGAGCPVSLVSGKDFCWHGARSGPGLGRALDLLAAF